LRKHHCRATAAAAHSGTTSPYHGMKLSAKRRISMPPLGVDIYG